MQITTKKSAIVEKTEELCHLIAEQPMFRELHDQLDIFQNDTQARTDYEALLEKQNFLQSKQQRGEQLTEEEIGDFENERDALLANPVAASFMDAQEGLAKLHEVINNLITRTFELGRVPTDEELVEAGGCGGGGCGSGCSC